MDFIEQYDGVLSKDFCDKAIQYFHYASEHGFTKNRQERGNARKLDKDGTTLFLLESFPLQHTNGELMSEFSQALWERCYPHYADKYSILKDLAAHSCYSMKIQKIEPGEWYHVWHCENFTRHDSNRILGWIAYLNDGFEAGETEFLYQQVRIKPKQGSIMMAPAGFTHVHRGNPPIGGIKYIITGWIEF